MTPLSDAAMRYSERLLGALRRRPDAPEADFWRRELIRSRHRAAVQAVERESL